MRWRRRKATFERGVWAGGQAGMEARGQACAACGWRAAWDGRAGSRAVGVWKEMVRVVKDTVKASI